MVDRFNNKVLAGVFIALWALMWILVFYRDLLSAMAVWGDSNTYTHCFFIIPAAIYFAYRSREKVLVAPPRPSYYLLPVLALWIVIWGIGYAASIQLLAHFSMIAIVPLIVWLAFGFSVFRGLWFPLTFIFFAIPIGEEAIPYLQSITADNAVGLLELFSVPVLRDGLYITIPSGKFVVAEACSGVRFLIASICFGYFYAYITYTSPVRRIVFIVVAMILPIVANSLRVFLIIMIAHFSDMKYAVGADHLLYGWIFFALILLSLIWVGGFWRQEPNDVKPDDKNTCDNPGVNAWYSVSLPAVFSLSFLPLIVVFAWQLNIDRLASQETQLLATELPENRLSYIAGREVRESDETVWRPHFKGSRRELFVELNGDGDLLYIATYLGESQGVELISSQNSIYRSGDWTVESSGQLWSEQYEQALGHLQLVGPRGERRSVVYWYQLHNYLDYRSYNIKIMQAINRLMLEQERPAYFVALFLPNLESSAATGERHLAVVDEVLERMQR